MHVDSPVNYVARPAAGSARARAAERPCLPPALSPSGKSRRTTALVLGNETLGTCLRPFDSGARGRASSPRLQPADGAAVAPTCPCSMRGRPASRPRCPANPSCSARHRRRFRSVLPGAAPADNRAELALGARATASWRSPPARRLRTARGLPRAPRPRRARRLRRHLDYKNRRVWFEKYAFAAPRTSIPATTARRFGTVHTEEYAHDHAQKPSRNERPHVHPPGSARAGPQLFTDACSIDVLHVRFNFRSPPGMRANSLGPKADRRFGGLVLLGYGTGQLVNAFHDRIGGRARC